MSRHAGSRKEAPRGDLINLSLPAQKESQILNSGSHKLLPMEL